jgi:hypothetical protein
MSRLKFSIKLLLWMIWAGMAFWLCCLGPWFSPEQMDKIPFYWNLMVCWLCMTGVVLFYVIFCARTLRSDFVHDPTDSRSRIHVDFMNRRVITLGLIGGFAVALPAFALAFISLLVAMPHFTAGFSEDELSYSLEDPSPSSSNPKPSAFLVAVDISASTLPGPKGEKRVEEVCNLVKYLLAADRDGRRLIRTEDDFHSFVFAGERESSFYSKDANFNKDALALKFCQDLTARLKENRLDANTTDIVSFLDYIAAWAASESKDYEHVTLIILSDFRQDKLPGEDGDRIETAVSNFMATIRNNGHIHVVGVPMPSSGGEQNVNGYDMLPYLQKFGAGQAGGRIWREIPWSQYLRRGADGRKAMLLANVYREIHHDRPLYLRYEVAPSEQGIQSLLKMPNNSNYGTVYMMLRPSREGEGALSKLAVTFGGSENLFDLSFGEANTSEFGAYRRQGIPLPITLASNLDLSRSAECDLLVVVPALAAVHSVRVVILPVVGNIAAEALRLALRFLSAAVILFALGACGTPEVIHTWWAKRKERRHAISS